MLKHLVAIGLAACSLVFAATGLQFASTNMTEARQAADAARPIVLAQYNPCPNLRCR